jgi:hypothetical protein
VHHRGADPLEGLQRLGQLALERPLVLHLLLELAGGDALLVEQRVPGVGARRQALAAHRQPQVVDRVVGHHDRRAAVGELVGDAGRVELVDDRRRVGRREVGEQRRHRRGGRPPDEEEPAEQQADGQQADDDLLAEADRRQHRARAPELPGEGGGHQTGILMISVKASTALFLMLTTISVASLASFAAIM